MKRKTSRTLLAGAGLLVVAVAVFGVSVGRALGTPLPQASAIPAGPLAPEQTAEAAEPAQSAATSGLSREVIAMAVERAPFESDRRPSRAYRMPDERVEATVRAAPELPDPPEFELLGAVSSPDGGFVVMRVDGGDPQLLRAGDTVEGYRIAAVEPDHAVMAGPGRDWQVPLASESPTVSRPSNDDDDRRRRRRGNDDDDDRREIRISPEIMERVGEVMRQMPGFQGGPVQFGNDGSISIVAPTQGNGPVIVRQNVQGNR